MANESPSEPRQEPESSSEDRPLLVIDDREPNDRIDEVGRRRTYRTEIRRLPVGDILLGDSAFEFKTPADFLSSIMDGRIQQQTRELDLNFPGKAYVVICGDVEKLRYTRSSWRSDPLAWNRALASYRGAIWSILEKREVGLILVKDLKEFCELLVAKAKRLQRGEKTTERPMTTLKGSDRTPAMEAEDVLCALSGIGRTAARGLLAHLGSIEAVVAADVKVLSQAPEIGKVRAQHIHAILHGKHVSEAPKTEAPASI